MTSKRNSRAFAQNEGDGDASHQNYQHHQPSSTASYRTRSSRNASNEDLRSNTSEEGDSEGNSMNKREKTVAMRCHTGPVTAKDMSLSATGEVNVTTMTEALEGYPPAPCKDRPLNFGVVVPGFYRSSYPKPEDYGYLRSLQLRTIVTLVKDDDVDRELGDFVTREGIRHVIIHMKGTKKETIPEQTMASIIHVLQEKRHWPIMLHCNHGKHRTGCVIAAMRKISGWSNREALDEYTSYAAPKARDCDVEYITGFQPAPFIRGQSIAEGSRFTPVQARNFRRAVVVTMLVLGLWFVSGASLVSRRRQLLR